MDKGEIVRFLAVMLLLSVVIIIVWEIAKNLIVMVLLLRSLQSPVIHTAEVFCGAI